MTKLTESDLADVSSQVEILSRVGGTQVQLNLVYAWAKAGDITMKQHELLCRFIYEE
jgi:hypothetical protein